MSQFLQTGNIFLNSQTSSNDIYIVKNHMSDAHGFYHILRYCFLFCLFTPNLLVNYDSKRFYSQRATFYFYFLIRRATLQNVTHRARIRHWHFFLFTSLSSPNTKLLSYMNMWFIYHNKICWWSQIRRPTSDKCGTTN